MIFKIYKDMKKNKKNKTFSEIYVPTSPAEKAYWQGLAQRARYYDQHPEALSELVEVNLDDLKNW